MTVKIPQLLAAILEATADEVSAKARVAGIRATLEDEARRRTHDEGAAPTWNATGVGRVSYQDVGKWSASVADPQAFASYVAEHHPDNVTATVHLNAADLEAVLEALEFAGIRPLRSELEVREPFGSAYLKGLEVAVDESARDEATGAIERTFTVTDVDQATGVVREVPGVSGSRTPGKLVVSLDRDRKADAVEAARRAAEQVVAEATVLDTEGAPVADPTAVSAFRDALLAAPADSVKDLAKALDLSQTGTRPELANRVAILAASNSGAGAVVEATLAKLVDEAPVEVTEPVHVTPDDLEPLDPADPDLGAKALERSEEYRQRMHDARVRAEAGDVVTTTGMEASTPAELAAEAEVAAAATPAPAPVAAGEEGATEPGDDDPALLALEAAGNREQLRALARAKGIAPGGTKRDVALALHLAGATAAEVV